MIEGERKWAFACYLPVLNIITCVLASVRMVQSEFVLLHARQGLVLFSFWFLTIIVALFSQSLGLLFWIIMLLLHGAGMAIAAVGVTIKIPLIGDVALKIPPYFLYRLLTKKGTDVKTQ